MHTAWDADRHFHAVQFPATSAENSSSAAQYLADALTAHQLALIVVTPDERTAVLEGLRARQVETGPAQASGRLLVLDVATSLAAFMIDGMPDIGRFNLLATTALASLLRGRTDRTVCIYGGMVHELWTTGNPEAATRLETLWNLLAITHHFSLLCGYSMASGYSDTDRRVICEQHSHLLAPQGALLLTTGLTCPDCGSTLPHRTLGDGGYPCQFCSVELLDIADLPTLRTAARDCQ